MKRKKIFYKFTRIVGTILISLYIISCSENDYFEWFDAPQQPQDTTPPSVPYGLTVNVISPGSTELYWEKSTDNSGYVSYNIYRNDNIIETSFYTNSYSDTRLYPLTQYCYTVIATDPSGNRSSQSNAACVMTPEDTVAPSTPKNLTITQLYSDDDEHQVRLIWSHSTDNGTLLGYKIYRNSINIENTSNFYYTDYTGNPDTDNCYTISAYDAGNNESDYSNTICSSGTWSLEMIDSGNKLQFVSIDTDKESYVHVGYVDNSLHEIGYIKHTHNKTGDWTSSIIDTSPYGSSCSSLTIDSANVIHMSYCKTFDGLVYATNSSIPWSIEIIDNSINVNPTSIVTDSNNFPHIAYMQERTVAYASNISGAWLLTLFMDIGIHSNYSPALTVDNLGFVHISYFDYNNKDLIYTTNSSGSWVTHVIDSIGDVGEYSSIAVDYTRKVHISYYDYTKRGIKYISNVTGVWTTQFLDDTGYAGTTSSITVDSSNKIHIVHTRSSRLLYSLFTSDKWLTYILDTESSVYGQLSIAIDASEHVHIGYRGGNYGTEIRHATNQ